MKTYAIATLLLTAILSPLAAEARIPGHPRVNQVNHRFYNERNRIGQGVRNGSISSSELARLRCEGRAMKAQERAMRAADGGHLTRRDQRILNREMNHRSREIWVDKHN